jgi:hypothetical protein
MRWQLRSTAPVRSRCWRLPAAPAVVPDIHASAADGDTFWVIAAHGRQAIKHHQRSPGARPRRTRLAPRTASLMPEDDTHNNDHVPPYQRTRAGAIATTPLTVRIDLDRPVRVTAKPCPLRARPAGQRRELGHPIQPYTLLAWGQAWSRDANRSAGMRVRFPSPAPPRKPRSSATPAKSLSALMTRPPPRACEYELACLARVFGRVLPGRCLVAPGDSLRA